MSRPYKKPALALDTDLVQDNTPQEIVPGIFIGSIHAAFNQDALMKHNISHILNASRIPATFPKHFTYLSIDIRDKDESNLLACIPASNIFIEAGIDAGGVLVHCFGGRSRSAALVAAFLMSSRNWTIDQAMEVIVSARQVASINKGFDRQLSAYLCTKYDVYAAQQVLLRNRVASLRHIRTALLKDTSSEQRAKSSGEAASPSQASPSQSGVLKRDRQAGNLDDSMDLDEDYAPNDGESKVTGSSGSASSSSPGDPRGSSLTALPLPRTSSGKVLDESVFPLPVSEGTAPNCRLSRPGSNSVRVIPPLRGLERRYDCLGCGFSLFAMSNVIREDLDLSEVMEAAKSLSWYSDVAGNSSISTEDDGANVPLKSVRNSSGGAKSFEGGHRVITSEKSADSISALSHGRDGGAGGHIDKACAKERVARAEEKGEDMDVDAAVPPAPTTGRHAQAKGFFDADDTADTNVGMTVGGISSSSSSSSSSSGSAVRPLRLPIEQAGGRGGGWSSSGRERPQSAEKRRWLARMSLLKADAKESISRPPLVPDDKSAKLAADDDSVVEVMQTGSSKHLFLEYLEWMGRAPLAGECEGLLHCPNCQKVLGSWSWGSEEGCGGGSSSQSYHDISSTTRLEPPLFAVLREAVQLAYMPLDQTPNATPRLSDSTDSTPRDSAASRDGSTSADSTADTSPRPFGSPRPGSGTRPGSGSLSARARAGVDQILLGRPGSGPRPGAPSVNRRSSSGSLRDSDSK